MRPPCTESFRTASSAGYCFDSNADPVALAAARLGAQPADAHARINAQSRSNGPAPWRRLRRYPHARPQRPGVRRAAKRRYEPLPSQDWISLGCCLMNRLAAAS